MYQTAIQFMQQLHPPPPQINSNDDLFGDYVAGQLKLITDLQIKATMKKNYFMQQMEQIPPEAPSIQLNISFFLRIMTTTTISFETLC